MVAGVFLPNGTGPFPVLLYSHGRSGTDLERIITRAFPTCAVTCATGSEGLCGSRAAPPRVRRDGGADREDSGVRLDVFGNCWGYPRFDRAAAAAAGRRRWRRSSGCATSRGPIRIASYWPVRRWAGSAAIATAAKNPPGVVAYINFAGGTGGNGTRAPEHSCGSDAMESLMRTLGRTNRVPGLWLYAQNDLYWGSRWPVAWHRAPSARPATSRTS